MLEQLEPPKMTMIDHSFQVGAPAYPVGVAMEFEIEWIHNDWKQNDEGELSHTAIKSLKKYVLKISDEQMEDILNQWKNGCVNYEEWLLELKHKHEEWKEDFDHKMESFLMLEPKQTFWQKVFRRTATTPK